jgi:predicted dinucleotide-binding enzyme
MTLTIGFIGAGQVARTIAASAVEHGHEVMLSNGRGPETLRAGIGELGTGASAVPVRVAAAADIVVLAVPWSRVEQALAGLPAWQGRILVDATNPFLGTAPDLLLADLGGEGASEIVARHAPGARVVKAFNSIRMSTYRAGPKSGDGHRVIFVSGDHLDAKVEIGKLIASFGFAVIDLGMLKDGGRVQQAGGPLAGQDLLLTRAPTE